MTYEQHSFQYYNLPPYIVVLTLKLILIHASYENQCALGQEEVIHEAGFRLSAKTEIKWKKIKKTENCLNEAQETVIKKDPLGQLPYQILYKAYAHLISKEVLKIWSKL